MDQQFERLKAALADRYAIQEELGAGGMATVYLAEDLKHRRKVAVKVLRPELAAVLGAERFLKEIEVTANLHHPHILPLHDSGEAGGFLYYVMPRVEGESLREKLSREKQLSIEETLEIAKAVASALDYAHRHEVIHRDIKPENILLHEGQPMVADFGIALAIRAAGGNRLTETGMSLGTPHYMSPEQAMGDRELDARSDVYSLACVTYEMLAGEPPYTGPTVQAIVAQVLTERPQRLAGRRDTVPPHVDATVHKALEKLPADRFTTAQEFADALTDARMAPAAATLPSTQAVPTVSGAAAWRALGKWMVVLALIFMGVGAALVWVLKPTPQPVVTRFTVPVEGGHEMFLGLLPRLALSPDGRTLVYHAQGRLHVRRLDRFESEPLDGTEGAEIPFFSPDGQWIGFAQGALKKVSVTGGPVTEIMNATADFGASWGGDGTIVYASGIGSSGLWRIPASGGVPERITTVIDSVLETAHIWPQSLAAGKLVLFTVVGPSGGRVDAKIALKDLETGERKTVIEGATYGRYVPTGHIVYVRVAGSTGTIFAVPFDLARRKVTGAEFPVQSGVRVAYWGGTASLAISHSGTVAFVRGSNAMRNLLFWVERDGRRQQLGSPMSGAYPEISPDGRRVAVYLRRPDNDDIFLLDAATGQRDRFTFSTAEDESPVWSPDGGRIAYSSAWTGQTRRIYVKEVDTGAEPVLLYTGPRHLHLTSWSPDGRWLALYEYHPETGEDIYVLPVDSVDHLIPVAVTSAGESDARFSPDGRWLAYESDETGSREVYIVSFPEIGGRQQVSTAGGAQPRWSRDSGELFFWKGYTLMATNVSTQGSFRRETPQPLFDMPDRDLLVFGGYDVTADGQRFLVRVKNPDAPAKEIHVVVNWFEVLRELGESGGD